MCGPRHEDCPSRPFLRHATERGRSRFCGETCREKAYDDSLQGAFPGNFRVARNLQTDEDIILQYGMGYFFPQSFYYWLENIRYRVFVLDASVPRRCLTACLRSSPSQMQGSITCPTPTGRDSTLARSTTPLPSFSTTHYSIVHSIIKSI